jgi:phosphatidylcholine synthase
MRFGVHILTAAGAGCAVLALFAAVDTGWPAMFAWLAAALAIDAIDGPLARRFEVAERVPRWSGDVLDLVVDFSTYVFVPAYAIAASGVLPAMLETASAVAIVATGALYFADRRMKMKDNYFRGFPGLWNMVAFYLLLLRPPQLIAAAAVAALAILTFVPFPFLHPVRVQRFRTFNLGLIGLWAVLAVIALATDLMPPAWITVALCAIGAYICVAGLFRPRSADRA